MRKVAWDLEAFATQVVVAPSVTDVSRERIHVRPVGGLPLIHWKSRDRLLPCAAQSARSTSLGRKPPATNRRTANDVRRTPDLAKRPRAGVLQAGAIGQGANPFLCWKFRTMGMNADALLDEIHRAQGTDNGVFAKIKDDPRVTSRAGGYGACPR